MKILVADDDPINRKYLRTLLGHEGHTVFECADGLRVWPASNRIFAMRSFPKCSCPRWTVFVCAMRLKHTSVILYTASYLSAADEKAALAMGADRFIRKPALPEVILKALHEVIENSRGGASKPKKPADLSALRKYSEVLVRQLEDTNIELTVANEALSENARRLRTIIESEPECLKVLARLSTEVPPAV